MFKITLAASALVVAGSVAFMAFHKAPVSDHDMALCEGSKVCEALMKEGNADQLKAFLKFRQGMKTFVDGWNQGMNELPVCGSEEIKAHGGLCRKD